MGWDSKRDGEYNRPDMTRVLRLPWGKVPVLRVEIGRNETCPCSSGKKVKQCCGQRDGIGRLWHLTVPTGERRRLTTYNAAELRRAAAQARLTTSQELIDLLDGKIMRVATRSGGVYVMSAQRH